ncbi:MAG TPA: hypothetical protein VJH94_00265 [Candidatus Paceibacterota bacterium]
MAVVRAPSTNGKPMIRIVNNLLTKAGFEIGTPIEVVYQQNIITLRILENANTIQKPPGPVAISTASGEAGAGEGNEYAGRTQSNPTDARKVVPSPLQPLRYVFSGHWNHDSPKQDTGLGSRQMRIALRR